jgi:hypothetical protein
VVFESRSLVLRIVQAFRLKPQGRLCSHGAYSGVVDAASHHSVKPTYAFLGNDLSADFVPPLPQANQVTIFRGNGAAGYASNAPGFIPEDPCLHARVKVNYHWHKARWHASNAPGFIPGDPYLHARVKVNYHWRKARWHASNAPGSRRDTAYCTRFLSTAHLPTTGRLLLGRTTCLNQTVPCHHWFSPVV